MDFDDVSEDCSLQKWSPLSYLLVNSIVFADTNFVIAGPLLEINQFLSCMLQTLQHHSLKHPEAPQNIRQ